MVAVPFQVFSETHSSLWMGLASLVQLPFLIAGSLWGGAYGDRYNQHTLLMLGSIIAALASGALALNAAPGIGALVLATFAGWVNRVIRRGRTVLLVILAWGAAMTAFGVVHLLWFGVVVLTIAGATDPVSPVLRSTSLQLAITDEFRNRISSIQMAVVTGGPRRGGAASGAVAGVTSREFSIVSGGLACIVRMAPLAWRRRIFWSASL